MYIYRTYFNLTASVIDIDGANAYLNEDDMSQYLKQDLRIPEAIRNVVEKIEWHLKDESSGIIELSTTKSLSTTELKAISEWVSGQNADGLGEGFEQQSFACYEDEGLDGYDGSDWDNEYIMASFDWETNVYLFEFIKNET